MGVAHFVRGAEVHGPTAARESSPSSGAAHAAARFHKNPHAAGTPAATQHRAWGRLPRRGLPSSRAIPTDGAAAGWLGALDGLPWLWLGGGRPGPHLPCIGRRSSCTGLAIARWLCSWRRGPGRRGRRHAGRLASLPGRALASLHSRPARGARALLPCVLCHAFRQVVLPPAPAAGRSAGGRLRATPGSLRVRPIRLCRWPQGGPQVVAFERAARLVCHRIDGRCGLALNGTFVCNPPTLQAGRHTLVRSLGLSRQGSKGGPMPAGPHWRPSAMRPNSQCKHGETT